MSTLLNILLFVLLLGIIITIHEAGHLIAAKIFNVYCGEFSIGMGPKIFSHKFKETLFCLRAIPIGGYVAMAGDNDNQIEPDVDESNLPPERTLKGIHPLKKIIIMLAGIFMNLILAVLIVAMIYLSIGKVAVSPKPIINQVTENSPAMSAGLKVGDEVIECKLDNGYSIKPSTFDELSAFLTTYEEGVVHFTIKRDNEQLKIDVTPEFNEEEGRFLMGIMSQERTVADVNFFNCWYYAIIYLRETMKLLITTLLGLFRGVGLKNLSGPVGIYKVTEQAVSMGATTYLNLVAIISLNVGLFNALPLPIMDGGRVLITIIEWIIGKPINEKLEKVIMTASVVLILALLLYVTSQDILKLVGK